MAIKKVHIENFKGVSSSEIVEIKPITIFVGANSSGKSSCLHALACLSQTVKVTNNNRPLILDDEFANVHLGRFIEVIHSKSYQDLLTLGISVDGVQFSEITENKLVVHEGALDATYSFKCTKRTQDVHLASAVIELNADGCQREFLARKSGGSYSVTQGKTPQKLSMDLEAAFFFDPRGFMVRPGTRVRAENFIPLLAAQNAIKDELTNTHYLGPFRQAPLRRYPTRGASPMEVGAMGESTITLLANEAVQSRTRKHIKQIARWLKTLGLAKSVEVTRLARSDLFDVSITLDDGSSFPIADLGYGLSQVLPVLTQCSFAPENSTLLFEQPEIHLHSVAARQLAKVFVDTVHQKDCHILIETHSPDFVKQCFQEVKSGSIDREDFRVYRVERYKGSTKLTTIDIDENFDVYENWEKGISVS